MTSAGSPRTYGRSRPLPGQKRMQRKARKAKSPSSVPYISQSSCQEERPPGLTTVAVDDDLMKGDETMGSVDDQTSIEEMDQDGMTDVDKLSSIKIGFNKFPHRRSRFSQLRETIANGWASHRRERSLCEMKAVEDCARATVLEIQAHASITLSSARWWYLIGKRPKCIFSLATQWNNVNHHDFIRQLNVP